MRDYLSIGSSPLGEDCAQVGSENYAEVARKECERFIVLLRKTHGKEPVGARLAIKSFPHDFGNYYEVVCWYDDAIEKSIEYAYKLEAETPELWDGCWTETGWQGDKM